MIYLDHNATTPLGAAARERLAALPADAFGNPKSLHPAGVAAKAVVDRGRAEVAGLLGARAAEIVFTGCGTESDVTAVWTMVCEARRRGELARIAFLCVEHPAIRVAIARAEALGLAQGLPVAVQSSGQIDFDDLDRVLASGVHGLCVMAANNETGVIADLEQIAQRVQGTAVHWHCDAVQAAGKVPVRVQEGALGAARTVAIAAHKMGGPKGVAALFVRRGTELDPLLPGGNQEAGRRAGTLAVRAIAAFGAAAQAASGRDMRATATLRDELERGLLALPAGGKVHGGERPRLPNTCSIALRTRGGEWASAETLMLGLAGQGIAVSTGAACTQGERKPSAVLTAMGVGSDQAAATLRLSFGEGNQRSDVHQVLTAISDLLS
jgi:cysteine desulfurase